jgi:hypothetical protein
MEQELNSIVMYGKETFFYKQGSRRISFITRLLILAKQSHKKEVLKLKNRAKIKIN